MAPSCPHPEQLRQFALGLADAAQFDTLAQHVELCAECLLHLERLDPDACRHVGQFEGLRTASWTRGADEKRWAETIRETRIAADAGRDVARRLLEGSVRLDRFELQKELGVGSFGYVFQAWDPRLERLVALKVQRAGRLASQEDIERF